MRLGAMELMKSLYEYELLTPGQLATVHSYNKRTIYNIIVDLHKQDQILKVDVPAIGRGAKAYALNASSARFVAESRNELHLYRKEDWGGIPGSFLNVLIANQVLCNLIEETKGIDGAGITEWLGRRTLMQRHPKDDEKRLLPKINGYAEFYYSHQKRPIYLNVLSGNESLIVLQDMMMEHVALISDDWPDVSKTLLLFVYLGKKAGDTILKIAEMMKRQSPDFPYVAVAKFEQLIKNGTLSKSWRTIDSERVSLLDMPFHESYVHDADDFIGKQEIKRFEYHHLPGFI